ncbi:hypothetical protein LCGC14_0362010 [marine sediment metagenome]|uniref:Uncharacterized protein n=1 Tax=marine sediment metagenome TaxID=412755 RepID=A0A0F9WFV8_9ZZZZ
MRTIILLMVVVALCGCQEQQQWGNGQPNDDWLGWFGNSNGSRVSYVIVNKINAIAPVVTDHEARLKALEARPVYDPNALAERVRLLEEKPTPPSSSNGISLNKDGVIVQKPVLVTLDKHNKEAWPFQYWANNPQPNGIACPECGAELYDTSPDLMLTSDPPQFWIVCKKCDYTGTRF